MKAVSSLSFLSIHVNYNLRKNKPRSINRFDIFTKNNFMKSILTFFFFITFLNISFAQEIKATVSDELQAQISGNGTVKADNYFLYDTA